MAVQTRLDDRLEAFDDSVQRHFGTTLLALMLVAILVAFLVLTIFYQVS